MLNVTVACKQKCFGHVKCHSGLETVNSNCCSELGFSCPVRCYLYSGYLRQVGNKPIWEAGALILPSQLNKAACSSIMKKKQKKLKCFCHVKLAWKGQQWRASWKKYSSRPAWIQDIKDTLGMKVHEAGKLARN
ncbi:hypothetical protein BsWGS_18282 [Bradybaena similaris]